MYSDGVFSKNENYGGSVNIPEIKLYEIENFTYAENALEIGNVNFLFKDMSDSVYRHVSVDSSTVNMNNLVFLGINDSKDVLSSSAVRTAIYYAIDKKTLLRRRIRAMQQQLRFCSILRFQNFRELQTSISPRVQMPTRQSPY